MYGSCAQGQMGPWVFQAVLSPCRAVAVRMGQLQEALNERHSIIKSLKAK